MAFEGHKFGKTRPKIYLGLLCERKWGEAHGCSHVVAKEVLSEYDRGRKEKVDVRYPTRIGIWS